MAEHSNKDFKMYSIQQAVPPLRLQNSQPIFHDANHVKMGRSPMISNYFEISSFDEGSLKEKKIQQK
jgi:hypothetical protein